MKILLYFEDENLIAKSGVGRALCHQKKALESAGVEYTTNYRTTDYDILHVNTYGINSEILVRNARHNGKPVIYHAHSTKEDFRNSYNFSNLVAPYINHRLVSLYKSADVLITPTPYSKRLLESYGLTMPIHAISNGIDLDEYQRSEQKEAAFREYFGLQPGEKTVIGIGLLFPRKGLIDFIRVAENLPEYRFIWFGDVSRLWMSKKILRLLDNPPANVEFPGYIKGDILEGAVTAADCFFFPSYEETEGIAVLEALASRQTCVLRDIGAYDSWAASGSNCYLGSSVTEFTELVRGVVEGRLASTADGGYRVAMDRNIESIGRQLKEVYESLL